MFKRYLSCISIIAFLRVVSAITSYANEFIAPEYFLTPSKWSPEASQARTAIVNGSQDLASQGPWTVTSKTVKPPSGNVADYLSWPPYAWPDCSKVGNTTELTPEQVWTECTYVTRDGLFNPDQRLVNDTGAFQAMSDAVFYNAISWRIANSSVYSSNAASWIKTFFLDVSTAMNPNLNYAQLLRGPGVQFGQHTGVLDLKCMAKIASAVLLFRDGQCAEWTAEIDQGFTAWSSNYIVWLKNNTLALGEKAATNNHGSFYFTQLAALQLIVGDKTGANATLHEYFSGIYKNQINANGDQPLESARTRPYHYRAYNLAAMITNGRLGQYIGFNVWNVTTNQGATIQTALDYAITIDASSSNETSYATELHPEVAAVASIYGDPTGKYAKYLANADPTYPTQPYFAYNNLSASGLVQADGSPLSSPNTSPNGGHTSGGRRSTYLGGFIVPIFVVSAMAIY